MAGRGTFDTTEWSLVLAAQEPSPDGRAALARLCERYWYPVYAYVRRRGHAPEDSQDLTQEFFTRILEKRWLRSVAPAKGRFRSFLLATCTHFLSNQRDRARARKRGSGCAIVPLDFAAAEARYGREPGDTLTPEQLFERRWALALLDHVLGAVRLELEAAGRGGQFDVLRSFLAGEPPSHAEAARRLGTSEAAVRVAVHRLRRRYRERLLAEIRRTLADPADVGEEVKYLLAVLGS